MAGTVNLPITITVDAGSAKTAVRDLQSELKNLVAGLGKTAFSTTGAGSPADFAGKVIEPIRNARKEAQKAGDELIETIDNVYARLNLSQQQNLRKWGRAGTEDIRAGIKAQEKNYQEFNKMLTGTGVFGSSLFGPGASAEKSARDSAKVFEDYQKLIDRATAANQKMTSSGGFSWLTGGQAGKSAEQSAKVFESLFTTWDKGHSSALKINNDLERMTEIGAQLGKAFTIQPGMSPERIKLIEKEINRVLALKAKLEQGMAEAEALGKKPQIQVVSDVQRYAERQSKSWSQGVAGETPHHGIPVTHEEAALIRDLPIFNNGMKELVTHTGRWREAMQGVASMMEMQARWFLGAGLIFGALAAIRSGVMAFLEYDKALMEIQAVTRITDQELGYISQKIVSISISTPHSTAALAGLAKTLVQAGLSARQTSDVLEDIAKTATVTGASLEQVGQVFSTAIFAWQMSAKESTSIGNTVAATLNFARLNIEDLGTAYNYTASIGNQFNISFKEMNSILAVFSNVGLRASTMATGFANILANLTKPPKAFKAILEETEQGYKGFVKALESESPTKFADMLSYLEKAGFKGTDAMRTLEQRAGRELAAALNMGSAAFRKMYDDIDRTTQLEEGFNNAMDATVNRLAVFRNYLSAIAITMGTTFKPLINTMIDALTFAGKIAFYVASGLGEMGFTVAVLVPGVLTLGGAIAYLVKIWKDLNTTLIVTSVLTKTSGIGIILTITAAIAGLYGWLKSSSGAFDNYKKSLSDAAEAAGVLAGKQKHINSIYEEAKQVVESFNDTLEHLNNIAVLSRIKLPELYHDKFSWDIEKEKFFNDLKRTYDDAINLMRTKAEEIQKEIDKAPGFFAKYFKSYTVARQKTGLEEQVRALEGEILRLNQEGAKAEEDRIQAGEKTKKDYTPERITSDANKLFDALRRAASGGKLSIGQEMANLREAMRKEIADELQKSGRTPLVEALSMLSEGREVPKEYEQLVKKYIDLIRKLADEKGNIADEMNKIARKYREIDPITQIYSDALENLKRLDELAHRKDISLKEKKWRTKQVKEGMYAKAEGIVSKDALRMDEIELGITKSRYAAEKNLLDLRQKLGKISIFSAESGKQALVQAEIIDEVLLKEKELATLSGTTFGEKEKIAKINKDILDLIRKMPTEEQKLLENYTTANKVLDEQLKKLEYREKLGGENVNSERRWLETKKTLLSAREAGIIPTDEELKALEDKLRQKFGWGNLGLDFGLEGFKAAVADGITEAERSLGDYYTWAVKLGRDSVDTIQRSTADFFYALSTAQGFDRAKHKNFWEYFKDVVDNFLKSIYQSVMRTLSDIYSQWLTSGLAKLMKELLKSKESLGQQDISALGTQASLTAILTAQAGAVTELASAYWGLAAAKVAAGVGSPMMSFGTTGVGAYTGGTYDVLPITHHNGGYIPKYHSGGLSPDERLAILQTGEYVVSRRGVATLDAINNGNVSGDSASKPTINNFYINAADAKSFADMVKRNPGPIIQAFNQDMRFAGSSRNAVRQYS